MDFFSQLHRHLEHPIEFKALIDNTISSTDAFQPLALLLMNPEISLRELLSAKNAAAEKFGISQYLFDYTLLFWSARPLLEQYRKNNIPEWIFWDTISDMKAKWRECREVMGEWGTFVFDWYIGFFHLTRFGFGRLQYDVATFKDEAVTIGNHTVRRGDSVYSCHIPSGSPLNKENILDSLGKAAEYFKKSPLVVHCDSWLLFPPVRNMVDSRSGIATFIDMFHIISVREQEGFPDAWRIYGAAGHLSPDKWPRDNSLRRGYGEHVAKGLEAGTGMGLLLYENGNVL